VKIESIAASTSLYIIGTSPPLTQHLSGVDIEGTQNAQSGHR